MTSRCKRFDGRRRRRRGGNRATAPSSPSSSSSTGVRRAAAVLLSLSSAASSYVAPAPPASFLNGGGWKGHSVRNRIAGDSRARRPRHLSSIATASRRKGRLFATNRDEEGEEGGDYSGDNNDDSLRSNLDRISWLPSVKLGKQPYSDGAFALGKRRQQRRENDSGEGYASLEAIGGSGSNPDGRDSSSATPPGYQNIEILPVLPMTMVPGLEGMLRGSADNDEDSSSSHAPSLHSSIDTGIGTPSIMDNSFASTGESNNPNDAPKLFAGTAGYLPHTKNHVFTVARQRYKRMYDDLIRLGKYHAAKRKGGLLRRDAGGGEGGPVTGEDVADEKRRFVVTTAHPTEEGVFAEYGLLFQLQDLDEVVDVTLDELQDLVDSGEIDDEGREVKDLFPHTHYEATHDVVGRVRIHRFVNPECYFGQGDDEVGGGRERAGEGGDYLMAEASVVELIENDIGKLRKKQRSRKKAETQAVAEEGPSTSSSSSTTTPTSLPSLALEEGTAASEVAKAVARITDELRSSVGELFQQQKKESSQPQKQVGLEDIFASSSSSAAAKPTPNDAASGNGNSLSKSDRTDGTSPSSRGEGGVSSVPLVPEGILVERRSTPSLTPPERALRESFARLVALQHELKEEFRFTRVSVETFGIGPVGVWLSAAAWSQFVEKRLEGCYADMQSEVQDGLIDYLEQLEKNGGGADDVLPWEVSGGDISDSAEEEITTSIVDFDDLPLGLQREFQRVQSRATTELGPVALERAIQMQRMVQATSYEERLEVLRECVEGEMQRLEARKMLRSLELGQDKDSIVGESGGAAAREEARSIFERLMSTTAGEEETGAGGYDSSSQEDNDEAFQ